MSWHHLFLFQVQELFLCVCVLYCQMYHSWIISYLSLQEKGSNAMILWNLFVLKLYRSSCLFSSLIPFISFVLSWLHYPGCCIIHSATHEHWLQMTLSKVMTVFHWWLSQMQVLMNAQENANVNSLSGYVKCTVWNFLM